MHPHSSEPERGLAPRPSTRVASDAAAAETIGELLQQRAEADGASEAFTFLENGEVVGGNWSYADLDRHARAVAAALERVAPPGERALLVSPSGLEWVAAFFGCVYAGITAVPLPHQGSRARAVRGKVARDAEASVVLGSERTLATVGPELPGVVTLAIEDALATDAAAFRPASVRPDSLLHLQYTSGSTGTPKGVMVTHANVLANERMFRDALQVDAASTVVTWVPLFHDMGLISSILLPLFIGARCVFMRPEAFLRQPMNWLRAISDYRGHAGGGPDFAYRLCAERARDADLENLDLSSWRRAWNGAEPVRASTLERFQAVFAPVGFRPDAFFPGYGLAEATLFVSGSVRRRGPRILAADASALERERLVEADPGGRTTHVVSCGRPASGLDVVIASRGRRLGEGEIGEILVAGPNVTSGYWRDGATRSRFREIGREGRFLRTGDLGSLIDGELFVLGRTDDMFVLRGQNYYATEIEAAATASHPLLPTCTAVAFAAEAGGDRRLVLLLEVPDTAMADSAAIESSIRAAVAEAHELTIGEIALVRRNSLPRTTIGKIRRRECQRAYEAGGLRRHSGGRRSEDAKVVD
jgi:acyl-CoA synthetase (AMP-forming)/AMP-acid ligase II